MGAEVVGRSTLQLALSLWSRPAWVLRSPQPDRRCWTAFLCKYWAQSVICSLNGRVHGRLKETCLPSRGKMNQSDERDSPWKTGCLTWGSSKVFWIYLVGGGGGVGGWWRGQLAVRLHQDKQGQLQVLLALLVFYFFLIAESQKLKGKYREKKGRRWWEKGKKPESRHMTSEK